MFQIRAGLAESPAWFLVQATEFDPEPINVANLRVRDIYASERIVQAILELLVGEKWLDRINDDYFLTDRGRELLKTIRERNNGFLAQLDLLPAAAMARLESYLRRIIEAGLMPADGSIPWCLARSRRRAPVDDAPPLAKIFHYFNDLNAFRDDAHMVAWQPYHIDGYAWEAFAFVRSGSATSAEAIFDQIAYRGYSRLEYVAALQTLTYRGWLTPSTTQPGEYQLAEAGRSAHAIVEARTDQYFYAPWSILSESELAETRDLLQQLHDQGQNNSRQ
jgi:hypothetical protein